MIAETVKHLDYKKVSSDNTEIVLALLIEVRDREVCSKSSIIAKLFRSFCVTGLLKHIYLLPLPLALYIGDMKNLYSLYSRTTVQLTRKLGEQ